MISIYTSFCISILTSILSIHHPPNQYRPWRCQGLERGISTPTNGTVSEFQDFFLVYGKIWIDTVDISIEIRTSS